MVHHDCQGHLLRHRIGPAIRHRLLASSSVAKVIRSAARPLLVDADAQALEAANGKREDRPENETVPFFVDGDIGRPGAWRARCRLLAYHGRQ